MVNEILLTLFVACFDNITMALVKNIVKSAADKSSDCLLNRLLDANFAIFQVLGCLSSHRHQIKVTGD